MMKRSTFLKILAGVAAYPFVGRDADAIFAGAEGLPETILPIIPYPLSVERRPGFFRLNRDTEIQAIDEFSAIAESFADAIGLTTGVRPMVRTIGGGTNAIRLLKTPSTPPNQEESYSLLAEEQLIEIQAPATPGLFYGLQTFLQLLYRATIPCVRINDRPRFAYRGLMLDEARSFYGKDYVKKTIDLISRYKFNVFHWHLTDDQGWRIEIKRYPRLTATGAYSTYPGTKETYGGFYTHEDIREIVAFAAERHVTIIPEIDMPGHIHAAVASYPEYSCTGGPFEVSDSWRGFADVLCPGKDESIEFAKNILREVMDLFPSKFIHSGGDECPRTRWRNCPHCQERIKKEGLSGVDHLQSWFSAQVSTFLKQNGRRMIGWEEVGDGGLPSDVTLEIWMKEEALARYTESSAYVINALDCPGTHDNNGRSPGSYARTYAWDPVPAYFSANQAAHVIGVETHLWTEGLRKTSDADWDLWPDPCVIAELAWSPGKKGPYTEFAARFDYHVEFLTASGLSFAKPAGWGAPVGNWKPETVSRSYRTVSWNLDRSLIPGPGVYEFEFVYAKGDHGIDVEWASLEGAGLAAIRDEHYGFAGGRSKDNVYRFPIDSIPRPVTLKLTASIRGNGGTDSSGMIFFRSRIVRPEP